MVTEELKAENVKLKDIIRKIYLLKTDESSFNLNDSVLFCKIYIIFFLEK